MGDAAESLALMNRQGCSGKRERICAAQNRLTKIVKTGPDATSVFNARPTMSQMEKQIGRELTAGGAHRIISKEIERDYCLCRTALHRFIKGTMLTVEGSIA